MTPYVSLSFKQSTGYVCYTNLSCL